MMKELPILQETKPAESCCGGTSCAPAAEPKMERGYWRSLEELANSPDFRLHADTEFPSKHEPWETAISRRDFLKIMGASMAMAAFSGCRKPIEKIFPYNEQPEILVPGKPLFYATVLPVNGYGVGVLAESHEGRPTRVEGNPKHPDSLGSADSTTLAMTLSLYDPDRSQNVVNAGMEQTWDALTAMLRREMATQAAKGGAGLRILTESITSPLVQAQLERLLKKFPEARWHMDEPAGREAMREGARIAFGRMLDAHYKIANADVILALDSDFMEEGIGHVRYSREFAGRRRTAENPAGPNRLYAAEPTPTLTGSNADHRLIVKASAMEDFARAVVRALGGGTSLGASLFSSAQSKWIEAVAKDLKRAGRRALVVAGPQQSAALHAMAHAANALLGSIGSTVVYTEPADQADKTASLKALTADMKEGKVDFLLVLDANPLYNAPADLDFEAAFKKVPTRVHYGLYQDETAHVSHWHIPAAHPLESWGDLRGSDGTVALQQPLIEPLYGGKTTAEVLSLMIDEAPENAHDLLQGFWQARWGAINFEKNWRTSLHDGIVAGTALPVQTPGLRGGWANDLPQSFPKAEGLEIVFRADPTIGDGRYANNGWLQEVPKSVTKLTWDNAAFVSPKTAEKLKVENEKNVELSLNGRRVIAPIWILPGQADDTVTVHLGHGRTRAGKVGNGHGFNAYALRTLSAASFSTGLSLKRASGSTKLACTQHHSSMENRALVREGTYEEFAKNPGFAQEMRHEPSDEHTLYTSHPPAADDYAWAMTIDLNACNGCNACVVGCQSENNIPVVGNDQVRRGREMHWIRVDRYYQGDVNEPEAAFQPVTCMHCENAPCEPVCPVGATVHSDEGINEMVYNRCIGTRYCSNNCPYKVRRFNFYQYTDYESPLMKLMNNPDVTVRMRGVMEKCTYCIQRVQGAKIEASKENRLVKDGEITTACESACPSRAITFGNLKDPNSRVSKLRNGPRNYGILTDLGTRPRTTYLARLRNPNPELA